jgi:Ras family protein T1
MARWALKAMLEPEDTFTFLQYLGFQGDVHAALHISRRRPLERTKGHVGRSTLKALVLGAPQSGKSAVLDHFIGLPFRMVRPSSPDPTSPTH